MDQRWKQAIIKELEALEMYGIWDPANLPEGKFAIDTRWVFTVKPNGVTQARLVAK